MDSKYLLKEFNGEPVEIGETSRRNHQDCPAGVDTKRRLYLTIPSDSPTTLLGYCHNCQEGTRAFLNIEPYRYKDKQADYKEEREILSGHYGQPITQFEEGESNPIRCYVESYVLGFEPVYDPTTGRLCLPIYSANDPDPIGWNCRAWKGQQFPKYILNVPKDWERVERWYGSPSELVIVEDQVSAYACYQAGYSALCIFGATVDPMTLYKHLSRELLKVVVWLDNDLEHIRNQARKIERDVKLIVPEHCKAECVWISGEPKHYSSNGIRELINGA